MSGLNKGEARPRAGVLETLAHRVTWWVGTVPALVLAVLSVVVWAATGPFFGFSDTWQLVINTSTTIITFLMVFLIQRAQNKDTLAIQVKLDEIVAAVHGASNRLISVEDLPEEEVRRLHDRYQSLAERALEHGLTNEACSVEEEDEDALVVNVGQPTAQVSGKKKRKQARRATRPHSE